MPTIYSMGSSSASHTYGNVIRAIEPEILKYFPKDYFKYKHISSQLVFREETKWREQTRAELRKREKPYIIIRPAFEHNTDGPFYSTPMTTNVYSNPNTISKQSIFALVKDYRNKLILGYRMNRDIINLEVRLVLNTVVDQLDIAKMMENNMPFNGPYQTKFSLESIIPVEMVDFLGKLNNIDLTRPGNQPTMMRYLRSHASYPITYKIRNSTSLPEYFAYMPTPVMITFSDLSYDQGNKKGMVDDTYEITFNVKLEFNLPGVYLLFGEENMPRHFKASIKHDITPTDSVYIPLYTMDRIFEEHNMVVNGFKLLNTVIFQTDDDKDGDKDELDLRTVIEPKFCKLVNYYREKFMSPDILFKFNVYGDYQKMVEGKDYEVIWPHFAIRILNSNHMMTYRVFVYCDLDRINTELAAMEDAASTEKSYASIGVDPRGPR